MFLPFLLQLLAGAVVPLFLFSFFKAPLLGSVARTGPSPRVSNQVIAYGTQGVRTLAQTYIWMGWAVYCALLAVTYTSAEFVRYPGAYYFAAFVCVNGPLAALSVWERSLAESGQELRAVRRRIHTFRLVTSIGFVIYCASPSFLHSPYGWFANDLIARAEGIAEAPSFVDESESAAVLPRSQEINGPAPALSLDPTLSAPPSTSASHTTPGVTDTPAEFCMRDVEDRRRARTDDSSVAQSCATAAAAGDPVAAYHLATLYAEGRGIRQDREAANRWYRIAAERGVVEAEALVQFEAPIVPASAPPGITAR